MRVHRIRRGLELPLLGEPEPHLEDGQPLPAVAIVAADYPGLKPRLEVQAGDAVRRGQLLFTDRAAPHVRYTAPGAGTVAGIHRGERRALQSVVIELHEGERGGGEPDEVRYAAFTGKPAAELTAGEIRALLVESGLWTALRARPFDHVPDPQSQPGALFVTAADTNPLAPPVDAVLADRQEDFAAGLAALVRLGGGAPAHLCRTAGSAIAAEGIDGVELHEFTGPHPAGTVGLHIHRIAPAGRERTAWHLGYQDVAAIGRLLATGHLPVERIVSLAGPGVARPRLLRTRLGASLDALTAGELAGGGNDGGAGGAPDLRTISGSVLNGRTAQGAVHGYLGRYHNQITVLPEGAERHFLGWLSPGARQFSTWRLFLSRLVRPRTFDFHTNRNGSRRTLFPVGIFERVLAFDLLPAPLLRALLSGDDERAEELGCLELAEEDVAPLSFVCPSKIEYGSVLRTALTRIEREG